jgi:methylthioribose-1-phosphate isomerase
MPNFFEERTVKWEKDKVVMIDQLRLPTQFRYVECTNHNQVADAIKRMVIRGAPAIGVAAAMALALAAKNSKAKNKDDLVNNLNAAAEIIRATRPTAVNLFWGVNQILKKVRTSSSGIEALKEEIVAEANRLADEDVEFNKKIGFYGASLLEDGDTVLTHCK